MYENEFQTRLAQLREKKGVSARDMSLSIGQNPGYINNIETGKALPSMSGFFYICEYLNVTPQEFFDAGNANPQVMKEFMEEGKKLDAESMAHILGIMKALNKGK